MAKSLFVISDLHLGGAEGFQMCSPAGRDRLAAFIDHVGRCTKDGDVHLVINGDVVDFLAEKEFASFTSDDLQATRKLASVIQSTGAVWKSLHDLLRAGGR